MKDRFFLDTNILVYTFDASSPDKRTIARQLLREALARGNGCISYQVVQEFLNVATRKFQQPLSALEARQYLDTVLTPLCEVSSSPALYQRALEIAGRWRFSFYDSLVIAAALSAGCGILYSEDLQHDQSLDTVRVVNPFPGS